tara:strand:+ start:74 stop:499 length:426 start_codon:yes stop_codon:yes gene_type:complete
MPKRRAFKSTAGPITVIDTAPLLAENAHIIPINKQNSALYYKIDTVKREVETVDGPMVEVHLKFIGKDETVEAEWDIAAVVGAIVDSKMSANRPEVLFWDDKFWAKAADRVGVEYYSKNKTYLLHEIQLINSDQLFDGLNI